MFSKFKFWQMNSKCLYHYIQWSHQHLVSDHPQKQCCVSLINSLWAATIFNSKYIKDSIFEALEDLSWVRKMKETSSVSKQLMLLLLILSVFVVEIVNSTTVGYDKKAILINGQRRVLISGSIHYPRSTPDVCSFYLFQISTLFLHLIKAEFLFVWILWIFVKWGLIADVGRSCKKG